ncbi:MAG: hypothetical protein H6746_00200 [Deltaproteobacteria bacterium]|nr:hypothetical protein [Deltaproteobacteria bacterium]
MKHAHSVVLSALLLLLLSACGSSNSALSGPHGDTIRRDSPRLVGDWADAETGTIFHVEMVDGVAQVTSIVDSDGEVFDIREQGWKDGHLTWTYHVPSTGYVNTFVVTNIGTEELGSTWSGTGGEGTERLLRQ